MRRIMHIDMDAFFVAVELLRRPELRGEPVVVGGRGVPSERGVVSTASYEARQFGVHSGMPLRTAFRRCPACHFLPVDHTACLKASARIMALLRGYSALVEEAGIDEAYLDISTVGQPVVLAREIKSRIREEIGLTASIGIGPNKLLAKMATELGKPDGLTCLTEADIESRLWPLPVDRLWGVGEKSARRLAQLGVRSIGELARLSEELLVANFKSARGHYLHRAANGIDEAPLESHRESKSLGHQATFQRDTDDWRIIENELRGLTEGLSQQLHNADSLARSVTVRLRYADFESHTHTMQLAVATDDFDTLLAAAEACLRRFSLPKKVRLVGVRLGGLLPAGSEARRSQGPDA